MNRKTQITLSLTVIVAVACLMFTCRQQEQASEPVHFAHYIDSSLTRTKQVEKCGSCHGEIYENWKKGPHAHALKGLQAHDLHLDSSENFPESYNPFVEERVAIICANCHIGKNIYENNFAGIDHAGLIAKVWKQNSPAIFRQGGFRRNMKDPEDAATGVDCMTCHVQNDQVVTNFTSDAPDTLGLIKSRFFSDNMNCYSCHHGQVKSLKALADEKQLDSEISCLSCHQEYDKSGKGTHYMYWRNNHISKKQPATLDIFESVNLRYKDQNGKPQLEFTWTNTVMPHVFSETGDAVCTVTAVYKDKKEKILFTQRLNRKDDTDKLQNGPPHFKIGTNGNKFEYKTTITQVADVKDRGQIDHFLITGLRKQQFWASAKELRKVFSKIVRPDELN